LSTSIPVPPSLARFRACRAFSLAVVDKATVSTRFFFSSFFSSSFLGYATALGFELHTISKFLGNLKSYNISQGRVRLRS
jgi:hypothetical protein